ncbi:MAG TPA: N-6 DNA methylase [Ktedonobacteraceae bacterium]|nr:N-6 DNA methylase [Ktedonobacteraceae bacterium]
MSEELQSRGMLNKGQVVFRYEYLVIGATNLLALRKAGYIPNRDYGNYGTRKPDRLLVDKNSNNPSVIAVVEDKKNGRFLNRKEIIKTIQQCNDVCQEVGAKIGIITDGSKYIWFNPNQPNEDNIYQDLTTHKSRSYTIITDENDSDLKKPFIIDRKEDQLDLKKLPDSTQETIRTIIELVTVLSSTNSTVKPMIQIDPLPLAKRVWQDIWVATGKSPEKCLYNVVELLIFKFLSDLEVLKEPANFAFLYSLYNNNSNDYVLDYYAKVCRPKIIELFPKGDDGTTVINGTIFVENDRPVLQMATLFRNSIKKFNEFGNEFGSLKNINKDFKTKLYENFLKQSEGLKTLGQYFTPRKVVRAIVQMSGVDHLVKGQKVCDPFCGVGGFVLEPINLYQSLRDNFLPISGSINPKIQFRGYDKGFEKDEERTIILAKANMLIYLADIVSKYNNMTNQFATIFNDVFKLLSQTNLGTLGIILENEEDKYDLIMTNPPYVTSGIRTLKNEIQEKTNLNDFYRINAGGVEGLALEWIIRSLKMGGKAFVIIPDGLLNRLNDKKIRQFLLEECILDAIISLPAKTFFLLLKKLTY